MDKELLCSYMESELIIEYVSTYDFAATLLWSVQRVTCKYCNHKMTDMKDKNDKYFLEFCENCGFWKAISIGNLGGFRDGWPASARRGIAKTYNVQSINVPINDLRRFLRKNPKHLANVNPFVFEELMLDCLKSAFPSCEVIKVGGRRDKGIDLIMVLTDNETYFVQVKRRSNIEKNEGVDVVRKLNGVLFRDNIAKGLVISTARNFTADAMEETWVKSKRGDQCYWQSIELYGYDDIVKWLNLPSKNPYEPWKGFAKGISISETIPLPEWVKHLT